MSEEFCKQEPGFESGKQFIELVKAQNAVTLDQLLSTDQKLRDQIDAHWFSFDSPAIVCAKHDLNTVDILLKHGANINERSSWWAGSFGILDGVNREQFEALVKRGATIGINNAAEQGDLELVRKLIGDDPKAVNRPAGDGQRPLHVATTVAVTKLLLQHGAELEARDLDHSATPAQYQVNRPDVCRCLIEMGAQPDIFMACALGDGDLVQQVVNDEPNALATRVDHCRHTSPIHESADAHIYTWRLKGGTTPLEIAKRFGHDELYDWIYQHSSAPEQFIAAPRSGNKELVDNIVATTPDVFQQLQSESLLEMSRAAWEGDLSAVRLMLAHGFDPHLPGVHHSTPLDRASFHGFLEIVELLLDIDQDPPLTMQNEFGGTPLGTCVYGSIHSWVESTDHLGTARLLIAAGAQFDESWLPAQNPAMDKLLREHLETR